MDQIFTVYQATLKSMNIDKIHKIHTPNIQGVFNKKAPAAATTLMERALMYIPKC